MVSCTSSPVTPSIVVGIWVGNEVGRAPITVTVPKVLTGASSFAFAGAHASAPAANAIAAGVEYRKFISKSPHAGPPRPGRKLTVTTASRQPRLIELDVSSGECGWTANAVGADRTRADGGCGSEIDNVFRDDEGGRGQERRLGQCAAGDERKRTRCMLLGAAIGVVTGVMPRMLRSVLMRRVSHMLRVIGRRGGGWRNDGWTECQFQPGRAD